MPRGRRVPINEEPIEKKEPVVEEVKEEKVEEKETKKGVVTALLNVRKEPGGEVVKVLNEGEIVNILDEKDGWYKIDDGYVMAKFIK